MLIVLRQNSVFNTKKETLDLDKDVHTYLKRKTETFLKVSNFIPSPFPNLRNFSGTRIA